MIRNTFMTALLTNRDEKQLGNFESPDDTLSSMAISRLAYWKALISSPVRAFIQKMDVDSKTPENIVERYAIRVGKFPMCPVVENICTLRNFGPQRNLISHICITDIHRVCFALTLDAFQDENLPRNQLNGHFSFGFLTSPLKFLILYHNSASWSFSIRLCKLLQKNGLGCVIHLSPLTPIEALSQQSIRGVTWVFNVRPQTISTGMVCAYHSVMKTCLVLHVTKVLQFALDYIKSSFDDL